jgi:transposase
VRSDEIEVVWAAGHDAVVALIEAQAARIAELVARVEELERQAGRSSHNSSLPPSRDSPDARKQRPKEQSGRKQGGQPGHPGRHRQMVADPDRVVEHWPSVCAGCGEQINDGDRVADGDPVAHQVSEIIVRVEVTEHRRMRARCDCGRCMPAGVSAGAFGPAAAAATATLTAARVSRREAARVLGDLCGLQISPASVETLVKQASDALEDAGGAGVALAARVRRHASVPRQRDRMAKVVTEPALEPICIASGSCLRTRPG